MLRGMVVGFKKPGPVTSYTSFDAYSIEATWRQTYESEEQVDVMMVEGQKQTITQGSTTISESYLAGGRGYDMGGTYGGNEVLVVFQTNANADLLAYVIKSRDELGGDWYTYSDAFMGGMTDEIWNTMQGWFSTTLTVSTSSGTITISDGGQSILVNASTHAMRYNEDYYDWTSNTSTEYSTLQTNGWLVDGTYTYQGINQDWNTIIDSLKAKGIANATITHDTVNGEITMTNGPWSITIADKNVGATQVYNYGDTLSEANCGKLFQRGNNYGFPRNGAVNTSSTKVDTTGYGPGNYYSSDTFITGEIDYWMDPQNLNLRGGTIGTELAMQGPCDNGYHIPTCDELRAFLAFYKVIHPTEGLGVFETYFHAPRVGDLYYGSGAGGGGGSAGYWTSGDTDRDPTSGRQRNLVLNYWQSYSGNLNLTFYGLAMGFSIRPFKNTYTLIPINQLWSTFGDTTDVQNEMNSHPYDYYLLGGCQSSLRLYSEGSMYVVWAEYNTNTNTRRVEKAV